MRCSLYKEPIKNTNYRKVFDDGDLEILRFNFEKSMYPERSTIEGLSTALDKTSEQVREWFRRERLKHQESKNNGFLSSSESS